MKNIKNRNMKEKICKINKIKTDSNVNCFYRTLTLQGPSFVSRI